MSPFTHPGPRTTDRTPAASPCPEWPFPGTGRGEMLGPGVPRRGIGKDARNGRSPVRGLGGMLEEAEHGTRGRGRRRPRARRRDPPARPLLNRPIGRAPPPLSRRLGGPSPGGGNMGITAVPAWPATPLTAHAPQAAVTCRRSVTPLARPLPPSAAAAVRTAPTPRQGDPGRPQHRLPQIPPQPAPPGATRAGRRGYFHGRTHKARRGRR